MSSLHRSPLATRRIITSQEGISASRTPVISPTSNSLGNSVGAPTARASFPRSANFSRSYENLRTDKLTSREKHSLGSLSVGQSSRVVDPLEQALEKHVRVAFEILARDQLAIIQQLHKLLDEVRQECQEQGETVRRLEQQLSEESTRRTTLELKLNKEHSDPVKRLEEDLVERLEGTWATCIQEEAAVRRAVATHLEDRVAALSCGLSRLRARVRRNSNSSPTWNTTPGGKMAPLPEDSGEERLARLDEAIEREAAARLEWDRRWRPWANIVSRQLGIEGAESLESKESSESFVDWRQFVHEKMLPPLSKDAAPHQVQGSASSSDCGGATDTLQTLQQSASETSIISARGDIDVCEVEDGAASGGVAALEVLVRHLQQPQHVHPSESKQPQQKQQLQQQQHEQVHSQGSTGKQEQILTPTGQSSQLEQTACAV